MAEPTKDEIKQQLDEANAELERLKAGASSQPVSVTIAQPNLAAEGAQAQIDGVAWLAAQEKPGVYLVGDEKVDGNGLPVKGQAAESEPT